jgi:hypothetical protein
VSAAGWVGPCSNVCGDKTDITDDFWLKHPDSRSTILI